MKKFFALALSVAMVAAVATGCSSQPASPAPSEPKTEQAEPKTEESKTETPEEKTEETAQADYPKGDITFLIPSGAGGGNDLTTRAMIPELQRQFGVNVVPTNKSESKGAIAASTLMNAQPDGQTLYFNSQTLILMPYGGMPDIDLDQFQAVAQTVEDTGIVYVNADSPYTTIQEFIDAAKEGQLKVGHNGVGALWNLAAIQLAKAADVDFQYIAYTSGGSQMLTALAAGEVDMCIVNPAEGKAMVEAGKVKPIACMGDTRIDIFPDVPTLKESGIELTFPVWRGVFTKKGVSEEILNEMDKAFAAVIESPEFVEYCQTSGLPIKYRDHKEFEEFVNSEIEIYDAIMKEIQE